MYTWHFDTNSIQLNQKYLGFKEESEDWLSERVCLNVWLFVWLKARKIHISSQIRDILHWLDPVIPLYASSFWNLKIWTGDWKKILIQIQRLSLCGDTGFLEILNCFYYHYHASVCMLHDGESQKTNLRLALHTPAIVCRGGPWVTRICHFNLLTSRRQGPRTPFSLSLGAN